MTATPRPSRSFEPTAAHTITLPDGQVAHAAHHAQSTRLERAFHTVRRGVWCLVGNGLSNQTFIDAPDGIVAVDTGESTEEMHEALDELAAVTARPVIAVLYTHFHYVAGTQAVFDRFGPLPVYGHELIEHNRARTASAIATTYGRGLVEQFGLALPADGPDGLVNVGLGRFFRNPAHAPFTGGYIPPTETFTGVTTLRIGGAEVEVVHGVVVLEIGRTHALVGAALVLAVPDGIGAARGQEHGERQRSRKETRAWPGSHRRPRGSGACRSGPRS